MVQIYNMFEHESILVLELELAAGGTLAEHVGLGGLPWGSASLLAAQVLSGLKSLHARGLIHRDIKPSNVLLTALHVPKIADLGIAHHLGERGRTKTGVLLGTPEYMSPEQIKGLVVNVQSDIYAMGIVLYEMLTGRVPFEGDSEYDVLEAQVHRHPDLSRLTGRAPERAIAAICKALAKDSCARWSDAAEFAREIAAEESR